MGKGKGIFITWLLVLAVNMAGLSVCGEEASPESPVAGNSGLSLESEPGSADDGNSYGAYVNHLESWERAEATVPVLDGVEKSVERGDTLDFQIQVPASGIYELVFSYRCTEKKDMRLSLQIDGKEPFTECGKLEFPSHWVNDGAVRTDGTGNEFAPEQVLYTGFVTRYAQDKVGMYNGAYRFALAAGSHSVRFHIQQGAGIIKKIAFDIPEEAAPYDKPEPDDKEGKANIAVIPLEGEDAAVKSSRTLIPLSDGTSASVHPSDPVKNKVNYIGGANWQECGDTLTWNFYVDTPGYYSLGIQYRQNVVLGGVSYRRLYIDGETPFAEAEKLSFPYSSNWRYYTFRQEDEIPYYFYLKEGPHTLSLSVTSGEMADVYAALKSIASSLGDLYVDITMVVGETVDIQRSYELFNQIPDFQERLSRNIGGLHKLAEQIEVLQGKTSGSTVSILRSAAEILRQMYDHPYSAHRYKSEFYNSYTNISALMGTITDMPLDIDRIFFVGDGAQEPDTSVPLLNRMGFSIKRFIATFMSDYQSISAENSEEALTIWVNWGRDQAQVLQSVIQDGFTGETGIPVTIKVVNATLIQAILSGKGPDCMLQMARTEPVNLAMRGALIDLSQFPDYAETAQQFNEDATLPYQYNGGVYALPDTQNFYMLFVRTDILDQMGLEIPRTWEELTHVATVLQRNNLQISLPYTQITDSTTVNVGAGGLSLYPTLVLQKGDFLYTDDGSSSTLTHPDTIQCFTEWTDWYTKYKIPVTMDFYNRFRIGSAPLGIAVYTLGTQLKAAAPEIEGRWTMVSLPGTPGENGQISRVSAGAGTGCAITRLSSNPQNAWRFLKWWTSAETQIRFSENMESVIGPLGRVATANTEAFAELGWDDELLEELLYQQSQVKELPEVPGGYYVSRGIDQAFWNVVEQNKNPKDMLLKWGAVVDEEIRRKEEEYANK